jgi:hypothetical protein
MANIEATEEKIELAAKRFDAANYYLEFHNEKKPMNWVVFN